eukprot:EC715424.1.p2 GENE.EC715424.1~~EC715424.1.p2  ORF type:complete len:152 (-),score=9.69 EC715424.1:40-495(-)
MSSNECCGSSRSSGIGACSSIGAAGGATGSFAERKRLIPAVGGRISRRGVDGFSSSSCVVARSGRICTGGDCISVDAGASWCFDGNAGVGGTDNALGLTGDRISGGASCRVSGGLFIGLSDGTVAGAGVYRSDGVDDDLASVGDDGEDIIQ